MKTKCYYQTTCALSETDECTKARRKQVLVDVAWYGNRHNHKCEVAYQQEMQGLKQTVEHLTGYEL
jgi:hypothetical protein